MFLFHRPKKREPIVLPPDPVVERTKQRTHDAATTAKMSADRLNTVFKQNGITLNILKAAGGGHER